jgi:hypothetical protein
MGKFIVCVIFALAVCGITSHFAPSVTHVLFQLGSVGVTGMMLIGLGSLIGGYKLVGK